MEALIQWFAVGGLAPPGDIWLCLETFLVVTAGGRKGLVISVYRIRARRGCCLIPSVHGDSPPQQTVWPDTSLVSRVGNPVLTQAGFRKTRQGITWLV